MTCEVIPMPRGGPTRREGAVGRRRRTWPPARRVLERLVEEAIVDAYSESEQRVGFLTMIDEHLVLPFETKVLGIAVVVDRIDVTEGDELVAVCRRGNNRQSIPLLDLLLPKPPPEGSEWIEAYRHWARGR